jgi:hypothetical protein
MTSTIPSLSTIKQEIPNSLWLTFSKRFSYVSHLGRPNASEWYFPVDLPIRSESKASANQCLACSLGLVGFRSPFLMFLRGLSLTYLSDGYPLTSTRVCCPLFVYDIRTSISLVCVESDYGVSISFQELDDFGRYVGFFEPFAFISPRVQRIIVLFCSSLTNTIILKP